MAALTQEGINDIINRNTLGGRIPFKEDGTKPTFDEGIAYIISQAQKHRTEEVVVPNDMAEALNLLRGLDGRYVEISVVDSKPYAAKIPRHFRNGVVTRYDEVQNALVIGQHRTGSCSCGPLVLAYDAKSPTKLALKDDPKISPENSARLYVKPDVQS